MDHIFFKSINEKLGSLQSLKESEPRMATSKANTLNALSVVSHNMDEAIRHLNRAYSSVVLLDKTSNAPNAKMLQGKIEQAAKMAEKVDSFVGQIYGFIEDIEI